MKPFNDINIDDFISMKHKEKSKYLLSNDHNTIKCFLYSQQLSKEIVTNLIDIANVIRQNKNNIEWMRYMSNILFYKSCSLYFTQCSTRTFTSFSIAAQSLGLNVEEIRNPEMSALYKGESEIDTLLALSYLTDIIIIRSMNPKLMEISAYEFIKRGIKTKIINGGSGSDQHPTQSLLELYTLSDSLDIINGNKEYTIGFVGDLKRSRTVRSLSYLLSLFPKVKHIFIAPDELQIGEDLIEYLKNKSIEYCCSSSLDDYIPVADALYIMRMQDEYTSTSEEIWKKYSEYYLSLDNIKKMKQNSCIIHPLPRRSELPVEIDFDSRAKYWEAITFGKYIRMALILYMFNKNDPEKLKMKLYE